MLRKLHKRSPSNSFLSVIYGHRRPVLRMIKGNHNLKWSGCPTHQLVAMRRQKDWMINALHCVALQMAKEIRELTKQRDLAQSRVEDLLRMVGNDDVSGKVKIY